MTGGGFNFDEQTAQRIVDTVRWAEGFPHTREPSPFEVPSNTGGGWLACKSQASQAIPPYGLARVVDMATAPNDPRPMILVDQPSTTFSRLYCVAGPQGVAKGGYGACSLGPVVDFLYSGSPANGDGYGPQASSWTAAKNYPSCLSVIGIVNANSTIARGRLAPINSIIGKLAGSLSVGGSATVNIYAGAGGSEAVVSSLTLSGRDWLMTSGETSLPSGTKVLCVWANGLWYIVGLESNDGAFGIGKTAGAIAKGASGTVNTYSDSSTSTGNTITATNLFGDVASAKWVAYAKLGSTYYLIAAEC